MLKLYQTHNPIMKSLIILQINLLTKGAILLIILRMKITQINHYLMDCLQKLCLQKV